MNRMLSIVIGLLILQPVFASDRPSIQFMPDPEAPPIICAPQVDEEPVLDGKLDDPAWQQAAKIDQLTSRNGGPSPTPTTVYVCYSRKALFIAFDCNEPRMDDLIITAQEGEDKWPGNCVEVFIDRKRTKTYYQQFVTNTKNAKNDYGFGNDIKWNGEWTSKAGRDDDGWVTEIRIPFIDFGYSKAPLGALWGMNLTRERDFNDKDTGRNLELSTWSLLGSFSSVRQYGLLYLGTKEQLAQRVETIELKAAIDRHVHSTLNPTAQIAAQFEDGVAQGSELDIILAKGGETLSKWTYDKLDTTRFSIDLPIAHLKPGQYEVRLQARNKEGRSSNAQKLSFKLEEPAEQPRTKGFVQINQTSDVSMPVSGWHLRTGIPFAEGVLYDPSTVRLTDRLGNTIPVQTRALATWSKGGAIKWLAVDAQTELSPDLSQHFRLYYGPDEKATPIDGISVIETDKKFTINTGAARFDIRKQHFNLIDAMWVGEKQIVTSGDDRGPYMVDGNGKKFTAVAGQECDVIIEEKGPLMTILRAEGAHWNGNETFGRYIVRLYFYKDLPYFRMQHTFVITEDTTKTTYNDIGVKFPFKGNTGRFGLPTQSESEVNTSGRFEADIDDTSLSLLQRRWDDFVVMENGKQPNILMNSDKAPGWFAKDNIAILVKDFWQNFPKELEVDRDSMTVHLWPGNGQTIMPMDQVASSEHGWRLMFAHQGKELNFNIPQEYYDGPIAKEYGFSYFRNGKYELANGGNARKSNAMGLGKTHDMLIAFGDHAATEKVDALNRAFQSEVHMLADPRYICATGAAGFLHPEDKASFPIEEDFMSCGFDYLMRTTFDLNEAYGMFNYGDSFTAIYRASENQKPRYYRLWAGYHHGRARMPWLLYMRSGDPKYLKWGNANAMHLADVDTCHWTTPYFASHPKLSSAKRVGGMCDYKGIVHWHTGSRGGEYNSQMDFLMYGYYLTGNRRLWDVLLEAGPYAVETGRGHPSRHGAGAISAQLQYYKATWDPRALLKIVDNLPRMYTKPAYEHHPPSIDWAPYLEPWIELSSDPAAIAHLMEFADWYASDPVTRPAGGAGQGRSTRAISLAYRLTGDPKYLLKAKAFTGLGPMLYQSPGDNYSGYVNWYPWSYISQQMPYLLRDVHAMKSVEKPLHTYAYSDFSSGPHTMYHYRSPDQLNTIIIALQEKEDQSFKVGGRYYAYTDATYKLIKPDGSIAKSGTILRADIDKVGDQYIFELEHPKDSQVGEYRFVLESRRPIKFWYSNISTLRTQRFVLPDRDSYQPHMFGTGRWFFRVPADCESFRIKVGSHSDQRQRSTATVFTPDDQPAATASIPFASEGEWLVVEPRRAHRGKVWAIALNTGVILDVQGIDRSFAAMPEGAVDPQ